MKTLDSIQHRQDVEGYNSKKVGSRRGLPHSPWMFFSEDIWQLTGLGEYVDMKCVGRKGKGSIKSQQKAVVLPNWGNQGFGVCCYQSSWGLRIKSWREEEHRRVKLKIWSISLQGFFWFLSHSCVRWDFNKSSRKRKLRVWRAEQKFPDSRDSRRTEISNWAHYGERDLKQSRLEVDISERPCSWCKGHVTERRTKLV